MKNNLLTNNILMKYGRILIALAHLIFVSCAYILSFYIRFEFSLPREYLPIIFKTLPAAIIIKMIIFYYFDLFSGLWHFVSMDDLRRIIKANVVASLIFIFSVNFIYGLVSYPRSIFIIDLLLCLALVSGIRFLIRSLKEKVIGSSVKKKKTLIVGAGEAGILVLKECRNLNLDVIGFVDDDATKKNTRIYGIKVLGNRSGIKEVVGKYNVEEIIIAIPSANGKVIRELISCCSLPGVSIKIIPGLYKIISGELEVRLREVLPEDLLGRETVKIDESEIASYIKDRGVLITGAGGSIGSELSRQIADFAPQKILLYDHNENDTYFLEIELKTKYPDLEIKTIIADIVDKETLEYVFLRYKPQIVFHSAAYKHVPLMEENPSAAVRNNIIATRNLIEISESNAIERFVFISTDKAINPTSVMGATKRIAEMILQAKARESTTRFMAVRFGNVIGSSGSVVPLFKKQIQEGGPITITHPEATRYFMSVKEAVQLVLQAGAIGRGGEIFVLDMGEPIKIVDLAKNLVMLSGLELDKDISIRYTGLRPGEKIVEEPLITKGGVEKTKYDKIYVAKPNNFESVALKQSIKELENLSDSKSDDKIIQEIKKILPLSFLNKNE